MTISKKLLAASTCAALVAACSSYPMYNAGGGSGSSGSGDDGSDLPDAAGPPPPSGDPIALTETFVHDERADTIAFAAATGPVHTHAGAPVSLADPNCADVYKFAYLAGETKPSYGGEVAPNPIAFQMAVNAPGTLRYRVRGDAGSIVDWTAVTDPGAADGTYTVALHRDGAHPALPAAGGKLTVDFDLGGGTALESRCFFYHPLAAPAQYGQLAKAATGLSTFTFAKQSPLGAVRAGSVALLDQAITQYASEPIAIDAVLAPPTAQLAKTVTDRYVNGELDTPVTAVNCGPPIIVTPPGGGGGVDGATPPPVYCNRVPKTVDTATTAPLGGGWQLALVDANGAALAACPASATTPTEVHCTLPARADGAAPVAYQLVVSRLPTTDLEPVAGVASAWQTIKYGTTVNSIYFGTPYVFQGNDIIWCVKSHQTLTTKYCDTYTIGFHLDALAAGHVDFGATAIAVSSGGAPLPAYAPPSQFAVDAFAWDLGDANLPAAAAALP